MRPQMPIAGGITLIVVGAIFKFAITTRPVQGIDLRIVGVILMLAGLAALLLPVLTHNRTRVVSRGRYDDQAIVEDDSPLIVEDSSSLRRYTRAESDRRPY